MSCFVVNKFDIDILMTAYADQAGAGSNLLDWTQLGRELLLENIKSFAACYRVARRPRGSDMRNEMAHSLVMARGYTFTRRIAHRAAVAKIARFYDYQACEHPGYETSRAKAMVDLLIERYPESLPLYDKMPWGISGAADLMTAGALCLVDVEGRLH